MQIPQDCLEKIANEILRRATIYVVLKHYAQGAKFKKAFSKILDAENYIKISRKGRLSIFRYHLNHRLPTNMIYVFGVHYVPIISNDLEYLNELYELEILPEWVDLEQDLVKYPVI